MTAGWEVLLNRKGGARWEPLSADNTTRDGWAWGHGVAIGDMDWQQAEMYDQSLLGLVGGFTDKHLRVPHLNKDEWGTYHRVRGKRCKMLDARPMTPESQR